jgi:MFS family permease
MAIEQLTRQAGNPAHGSRKTWMTADHPSYKWVALTNTTLGILLAAVNGSIVLISLPGIFNGIRLDPLQPGNVSYLLWVLMGYLLVTAVLVVALGRLGDMWGRVRIYNAGFAIFTITSVLLSLDPMHGGGGALWLIGWRVAQAVGGSMLMANSAAILTDAFPQRQRGMALGINMVAGIAGSFIGLVLGGVLVEWDWRSVFWVNVPIGVIGTVWAYRSLHETGLRTPGKMDWWGNATFAIGLTVLLAGITYGIQPYGGHVMGWSNPWVLAGLIGGVAMLVVFCLVEMRVANPMFPLRLFADAAFAGGNLATLLGSIGRGGLQFMLIIWLQGIWLPLHGYDYVDTPLWAGIYMLPLTVGFLAAGPISGYMSDRFGARLFAAGGFVIMAASFAGLLALPTNFSYWLFGLLIFLNGLGGGLFAAPNTSIIMSSVPADARGAASGMRATFQNAGMVLSMGVFFSLMIAGLSGSMPHTLLSGLTAQGVPAPAAQTISLLPPVGVLFAAFLGYNPIQHLLGPDILNTLPKANADRLTGREFFPDLISQPFHSGIVVVFSMAIALCLVAALASLVKGKPAAVAAGAGAAENAAPTPQARAELVDAETAEWETSADWELAGVGSILPEDLASQPGIAGRVGDSGGRPVVGATVTLIDHGGQQQGHARSREGGRYALEVAPGTYVVLVAADGYHPDAAGVTIASRQLAHDVTLSGTAGLRGVVRDETGAPVGGATVVITDGRGEVVDTTSTGADGEFAVPGLYPALFTVVASAHRHCPVAVTVVVGLDAAEPCELVLTPSAGIVGTVRHHGTDRPIADAWVALLDIDGSQIATTITDVDGTYVLADLAPGEYTVRVSGYPAVSVPLTLDGEREPSLDLHLGHSA